MKSFKALAEESGNRVSASCRCFHNGKEKLRTSSTGICNKFRLAFIFSLTLDRKAAELDSSILEGENPFKKLREKTLSL